MKKRDVLFLCQFFYPEYISSARLPYETMVALHRAGFSVGALCGYPHEYTREHHIPLTETVDGIPIRRLKYLQLDRSGFVGRLVNYFSFTFMVLLNLWRLREYKTVVVYSNPPILPWIASWAKGLFGTRLVFVAYDLYPEVATVTHTLGENSLICRLMRYGNKRVFARVDHVVALSSEMRDYILENRSVPPEKVTVIPNWYPDDRQTARLRQETSFYSRVGDRFVVSYFGNMGTMQDMDTILEAMDSLQDDNSVFFLFAGHGNKMECLRRTVAERGYRNAAIYPYLHGQDFQDALAISDCALITLEKGATGLCVPSKTYSYMMQGIPLCAVMDECDIVRDIEAGAGFWVKNGEGGLLARSISQLSRDPGRVARMRRRCRELYLENYTPEICTGKYVELFQKLERESGGNTR